MINLFVYLFNILTQTTEIPVAFSRVYRSTTVFCKVKIQWNSSELICIKIPLCLYIHNPDVHCSDNPSLPFLANKQAMMSS